MCLRVFAIVHLVAGRYEFSVYPCVSVYPVCAVCSPGLVSKCMCDSVCVFSVAIPESVFVCVSIFRMFPWAPLYFSSEALPPAWWMWWYILHMYVCLWVSLCVNLFYGHPHVTVASVPLHVRPRPPVGV